MAPFLGNVMAAPTPQNAVAHSTIGNTTVLVPAASSGNVATAGNRDLITSLAFASTATDRIKLLPNPADHVFDFNTPPLKSATVAGLGGRIVISDRVAFPALVGNGVSMAVGFIGPCGLSTPHSHPRSAEINIVVQGTLVAEFVAENGAPSIRNTLTKYQMTVFPQGSIHSEFNPNCEDAIFVAGFADEEPGASQSAQRFFDVNDDILQATLNNNAIFDGADIDQIRARIPANVAKGVDACLKKCGIPKR